jgi:hypothetical protein
LKQSVKTTLIVALIAVVAYFGFGYINSYFGWYSHQHWKQRKGSMDINDARKRGVFVKELDYKVEGYSGDLYGFKPFIEKAYTWGYHTSEQTVPWTNTNYPYQISFSYARSSNFGVLLTNEGDAQVDSSGRYLKSPYLNDTMILEIGGEGVPRGARIKVWE